MNRRALAAGLVLAQLLVVAACGGGGSASPPPPSSVAPPPQTPIPPPLPPQSYPTSCETRDIYTLCTTIKNDQVAAETLAHLTEEFFRVYPLLVNRFNHAAPLTVNFVIDDANYAAYANGDTVVYQWLNFVTFPESYDIVTHELTHIVEAYDWNWAPSYITEGIADYARYHYGRNNEAAGWMLRPPVPGVSYTAGYTVTARFLIWVEQTYHVELVEALDAACRGRTYDPSVWVSVTGKTVDELWGEYVADTEFVPPPPQQS
jgi:hypothetical protein